MSLRGFDLTLRKVNAIMIYRQKLFLAKNAAKINTSFGDMMKLTLGIWAPPAHHFHLPGVQVGWRRGRNRKLDLLPLFGLFVDLC